MTHSNGINIASNQTKCKRKLYKQKKKFRSVRNAPSAKNSAIFRLRNPEEKTVHFFDMISGHADAV